MVWKKLKDRNNVIALLLAAIAVVLVFRLIAPDNGQRILQRPVGKQAYKEHIGGCSEGLFLDRYGREIAGNRPGYVVEIAKTEIVEEKISDVAQDLVGYWTATRSISG